MCVFSKPEVEFFFQTWKSVGFEGPVDTTFLISCLLGFFLLPGPVVKE